jgi:hypothetical protein
VIFTVINYISLRICAITSTVQPLPSILYRCVSDTQSVYPSGTVCSLSHSIGVSLRTIPLFNRKLLPSQADAVSVGVLPSSPR